MEITEATTKYVKFHDTKYGNYEEYYEVNGKKEGSYLQVCEINNRILVKGTYANGKKNGKFYEFIDFYGWYDTFGIYINDLKEGEWIKIDTYDSKTFEIFNYKNGVQDGLQIVKESGEIHIFNCINGIKQGEYKTYMPYKKYKYVDIDYYENGESTGYTRMINNNPNITKFKFKFKEDLKEYKYGDMKYYNDYVKKDKHLYED